MVAPRRHRAAGCGLPRAHRGAAIVSADIQPIEPGSTCGPLGRTHLCDEIMQECNAYFPIAATLVATVTTPVAFNTVNYLSFTPLYLVALIAAGNDVINAIEISGTDYLDGAIANDTFVNAIGRDPLPFPAANMPKGGIKFTQAVPVLITFTTIGAATTVSYVAIGIAER